MIFKTYGPTLWITQTITHYESSHQGQTFPISGAREDGAATKSLPYLIYPPSHINGATGLARERQINDKRLLIDGRQTEETLGCAAQRNTH